MMELYTQTGRGDDMARFVALILKLAQAERVHRVPGSAPISTMTPWPTLACPGSWRAAK